MSITNKKVLYMGDTSLDTAASYLSLVLEDAGFGYDYVASSERLGAGDLGTRYDLYIVSDFPSANFDGEAMLEIAGAVAAGSGLLMIGGWESFQGEAGGYYGTAVGDLLPVEISRVDDRINSARPCCVIKKQDHPILEGLPFESPPLVAGYNRFVAKADGEEILSLSSFRTRIDDDGSVSFMQINRDPFLVIGEAEKGRTAALATDLAPHWVGGFVDWGEERVSLSAPGREVEIGDLYRRFVVQLLRWCHGGA